MTNRRYLNAIISLLLLISVGCSSTGVSGFQSTQEPGVFPPELTSPLPAPLPISNLSPEEAAADLAGAVLADDQNSMPALLAAFQQSGIAIRAIDGSLANKPAEPWQGMIYDAWEMQLLLHMIRRQNGTVLISLSDLSETIREAVPEFSDAPIDQLLLNDIRADAKSSQPTKRFFALFIVELGRQAQTSTPYDLMGDLDPNTVSLDGIQSSLILGRLATDLLIYAGSQTSDMENTNQGGVLFRPALRPLTDGSLPCTMSKTEQNIMDITAFAFDKGLKGLEIFGHGWGGLYDYLGNHKVAGAERTGNIVRGASVLFSLGKFMYTYAALRVDITIDKEPLVRTKEMRPRTGAAQKLVAVVRMSTGNVQLVNCYRIMLNAAGLDFSVPQDGVLKGVHIAWDGRAGFNQATLDNIVQFVADPRSRIQEGANTSSGLNPVTNQATDDKGMAYISVEGAGQRNPVSSAASEVAKKATVGVQVAIKGGDMFSDVKDAGVDSLGGIDEVLTIPMEILQRMKWATSGSLTFEVTDWGTAGYLAELYGGDGDFLPDGEVTFVICNLDQPFTQVDPTLKAGEIGFFSYIPSTGREGAISFDDRWIVVVEHGAVGYAHLLGQGKYTITEPAVGDPGLSGFPDGTLYMTIEYDVNRENNGEVALEYQASDFLILTPLTTNECSQP